ncbi:hypothetical protein RJT34_08385 [Clitoria ternatea]|uniref:Uncharacterized protein n=1 Tax=Clitoria ternatea TaxID=43366 RepID=A0AAN9K655_CLITE
MTEIPLLWSMGRQALLLDYDGWFLIMAASGVELWQPADDIEEVPDFTLLHNIREEVGKRPSEKSSVIQYLGEAGCYVS